MGWDFLAKPWFDERTSVFMRKIKVWKRRKPSCCRKVALFSFSLAVSCEAKELSAACSCFLPPGVTKQRSYPESRWCTHEWGEHTLYSIHCRIQWPRDGDGPHKEDGGSGIPKSWHQSQAWPVPQHHPYHTCPVCFSFSTINLLRASKRSTFVLAVVSVVFWPSDAGCRWRSSWIVQLRQTPIYVSLQPLRISQVKSIE